MKHFSILFLCLIFPLAGMPQNTESTGPTEKKEVVKEPACGLLPGVIALTPSHTEISSTCPEDSRTCKPNANIEIAVTALDPEDVMVIYLYTVSAGKIIGTGANVVWDLSNVEPGTYMITAAVDYEGNPWKRPLGQTQTKVIKISEKIERIDDK